MQTTERPQFAKLVESLLAGFNVPITEARVDAYWRGCRTMHVLAFEQTVDHVLGPTGEEDLPTPRQMHVIHRRIVGERRAASMPPPAPEGPEQDIFDLYTSRVLLTFLRMKARRVGSGATPESLAALLDCKKRFAAGYREMCITEPEASLELRDALVDAFEPLYAPIQAQVPPPVMDTSEGLLRLGLFA